MPSRIRFSAWRLGALSLASLLAACGGGSGEGTPSDGIGSPSRLSVQFSAPAAENVFTTGEPLPVAAMVALNGAPAADGSTVQFSAGPVTATALTVAGVARASLAGLATPGHQALQATATVDGTTASAVRTVYLRPAPQPMRVLVPAYFYPSSGSGAAAWDALAAGAAAHPEVRVTAILNPSDGPTRGVDQHILRAATAFHQAGGQLIGYVYTRYGTGERPLASILSDIDAYFDQYGPQLVRGIFLDEMAATTDRLDFYRAIHRHIKSRDATLLVVGNPGTIPAPGYAEVADVLTTFENRGATYANYDPRTPAAEWLYTVPNARQAALVHNVDSCAAMQGVVQAAASAQYQVGWLYVTHRSFNPASGLGNPWNGLPNYWTGLIDTVAAVNAGRPLPTCS
jgi:hypothetical protein